MRRIKFLGKSQRDFLDLVIQRLNSPSLRGLLQFGFDVKYSTLKDYYNGSRLLSEEFFDDLCDVARIDKDWLDFEYVDSNWGQVKGGGIGKRSK